MFFSIRLLLTFQITYLGDRRLFIGSCLSDSLLVRFSTTSTVIAQDSLTFKVAAVNGLEGESDPAEDTPSIIVNGSSQDVDMDIEPSSSVNENGLAPSIDETDIELYGPEPFTKSTRSFQINEYEFEVRQHFISAYNF